MILIALMWHRIPPGPDNFKKVIKYLTFKNPFYCDFESVANILFSFKTNFGQRSIQSYQTVAIVKGIFRVLLITHIYIIQFPGKWPYAFPDLRLS